MLGLQRAQRKPSYLKPELYSTLNPTNKGRDMAGPKGSSHNTEVCHWHPSYLNRPVLATFIITFLALIVSCQVLYYYSNENYGLASSYQGLHYLWTYGPTAILTLVASFWARVEFQTKISAPWCRMLKGPATSQQSVVLDYVSQFQPFAIYAAVKNEDYPVAASALISLLLRLAIVISTSFIVLSPTDVLMRDIKVTLNDQFIDDPSGLSATGALAYASLSALILNNISLPEGISTKYAYVKAETDIQNISELTTQVDGFEGGLRCEPATVFPVRSTIYGQYLPSTNRTLRLKSDSCEMTRCVSVIRTRVLRLAAAFACSREHVMGSTVPTIGESASWHLLLSTHPAFPSTIHPTLKYLMETSPSYEPILSYVHHFTK